MREKDSKTFPASPWYIYIVRCRDNSLYTGITTNLRRRLAEHNSSVKGAKYTRSRRPVVLVHSEKVASRSLAAKREFQIKQMGLAAKLRLLGSQED